MARNWRLILIAFSFLCAGAAALFWAGKVARKSPSAEAAFQGSSACRKCHPKFYELWSSSHHGRAMQPFTAEFARRNLRMDQAPVRVGEVTYAPEPDAQGGSIVERSSTAIRRYQLEHAMGGKNVYYFLTTLERGRLQVLPLAYDVRLKTWIDSTGSMVMHESGPSAAPVNWRDPALTFNTSCYGCHVSQLATNYDLNSDTYHTRWLEPGINCETCHGPSAGHLRVLEEAQREKRNRPPEDLKIISVRKLSTAQRNDLCASCHAKLMAITTGFKPGDRFFDHYDLGALENDDFFPDGRDYRENYTITSWRMSPCFKSGELDCLHCHTSSGRYRFKDDRTANDACLPCHAERVRNEAAHTHHRAGSVGSRCISCHMPTTEYARMRRSDHSMRPPTPTTTIAYKSPNACNSCHTDRGAAWADRTVRQWYKRDYQARVLALAGLVDAARRQDWSQLPGILAYIQRAGHDEIFTASLIRLLAACRDPSRLRVLAKSMDDSSPLVRAAAVMALSQEMTQEAVLPLLQAAKDEYAIVRIQAGAALARLPGFHMDEATRETVEHAMREYVASLEARPDDFRRHLNLGVLYADRGQLEQSINEDRLALRLRPDAAEPLVNESVVYSRLGQVGRAEEALRRAIKTEPANSAALYNLGLLLAENNRLPDAENALRRALDADPNNAAAAYNLCVIVSRGRPDEAIGLCRRAVASAPGDPKYSYTLAYYLVQKGDLTAATTVLEQTIRAGIACSSCDQLLTQIQNASKPNRER
jgi:tetratricopeptide (TPR) repeat protein